MSDCRPEEGRPVLICTKYRGVFFGFATCTRGKSIYLMCCKMAIHWGTTRGVQELAATGPTSESIIGAPCDGEIRKVTSVFEVTNEAMIKWLEA